MTNITNFLKETIKCLPCYCKHREIQLQSQTRVGHSSCPYGMVDICQNDPEFIPVLIFERKLALFSYGY